MRACRDLDSLPPEIDRPGSAPEFLLLHVHDIGGGMENIPIPDFGDVAGLTGLYWQAITNIRSPDMPEADKQAWIEMIDQEFRGPREVTGSESPKFPAGMSPAGPRRRHGW